MTNAVPELDSTQLSATLRAMAPVSYDSAMRALRLGALAGFALVVGIIAVLLSVERAPVLGLLLIAFCAPLMTVRWWRAGFVPRSVAIVGAGLGLAALAGASITSFWLGSWITAGALLIVTLLLALAARSVLRAWRELGPMRSLINPSTLAAVASG